MLYVQLSTRVATQRLDQEASAREALTSLYNLFTSVRQTLLDVGPDAVAGPESVGPLAIRLLNDGLRPFLTKWHSELSAFEDEEALRLARELGPQLKGNQHESRWDAQDEFLEALDNLQTNLRAITHAFGVVCDAELRTTKEQEAK
ncbi:MAG: hypothetical protein AAF851_09250 [Myxococcota bacterium]